MPASPIRSPLQNRLLLLGGILAVLTAGAWLRFAKLDRRPVHFDEATNARILADRIEHAEYHFDPTHFHGPLLSLLSAPVARLRGESSWAALTKPTLRLPVAACGLLTVAGALWLGVGIGRENGLAAAAFVASSPLLVYYSRMYIHEPLFVACGMLTLLSLLAFLRRPAAGPALCAGIGVGVMAGTRETVVISLFCWTLAALPRLWPHRRNITVSAPALRRTAAALVPALAIVLLAYSDFGRHPSGIADFLRSYFVYRPEPGHEKPAAYFLELLLWPRVRGGQWWSEGGVLLLALFGYLRCAPGTARDRCRFLVHAGILHLAVFSAIAYKTPWLACLGWLHLCGAAGLGAVCLCNTVPRTARIPALGLVLALLAWQTLQSHRAAFRFASDPRNPYAYVPTSTDLERMAAWLDELSREDARLREGVVTVVGSGYWPLPWYLRGFEQVGYYDAFPADASDRPLVLLVNPDEAPDLSPLAATHALFPRGLRNEVLLTVAIRNDIWAAAQPEVSP